MTGAATSAAADRNLLLGMLALQMDFISREQLIAGMQAWVLEKNTPLGEHLARQGALDDQQRGLLEPLVAMHVRAHCNDPQQSLAAVGAARTIREDLRRLADSEVEASLDRVSHLTAGGSAVDPYATVALDPSDGAKPAGRFRILRPHAEGGLGRVYVARDEELGREVALKEIKPERADVGASRSRFIREAEITGGLEHPGVVPVYSLGAYPDGRPFYAMRFIRGDSLKEAIDDYHRAPAVGASSTENSLPLRRLLQRLIAVCEAVAYAHSRGVLHRDLKPANIMLGRYGETLVVDWGLAKALGASAKAGDQRAAAEPPAGAAPRELPEAPLVPTSDGGSEPTLDGSAIGTPGYVSPEQASGRLDQVGPASDVFSLGATLYSVLTGRPPYQGENVLAQARAARFDPPRAIRPDVPRALEAICLQAMAAAPEERYASARALAQDLERFLADQPVAAYREPAGERLSRWARQNRSLVRAGGGALVATCFVSILAAALIFVAWIDSQEQRSQADSDRKRADGALQVAEAARKRADGALQVAEAARKRAEDLATRYAQIAASERALAHQKGALVEFMVGLFQTADPIAMSGADFFIPKEDSESLTGEEILRRGNAYVLSNNSEFDPLTRAAVMNAIGNAYRQLGSFDEARPLLEESLRIRRESAGVSRADLAASCFHLGWCYHEMGDFPHARPLYDEALAIFRTLQTPGNARQTAVVMRNLAWMLGFEGESDTAERMFRETIAFISSTRGHSKKDLAIAKFGLAFSLIDQNKYLEGYTAALDGQQEWARTQQNRDFNAAATAFCLGVIARGLPEVPLQSLMLGPKYNLRQSESQLRQALETFSKAAGPDHYVTGIMHFELGRTLRALGKLDDAEVQYRAGLRIAREKVHMEHPRLIIALEEFGDFLKSRGKTDEAKAVWQEFVDAQRRRFGGEHQYVARALAAQARFLLSVDDYDQADCALLECVAVCRANPLVERGLFPVALADLGFCSLRRDQYADAETQLTEAIALLGNQTSPHYDLSYERVRAMADLADALAYQGKASQAEQQFAAARTAAAAYKGRPSDARLAKDYVLENESAFWRRSNNPQRAAEASLLRRELWPKNTRELLSIAAELAACAELYPPPRTEADEQRRRESIRESLATLQMAIDAGHQSRSALERAKRFLPLRGEPEFQRLLEQLK